jgi:hypothetical protein
MMNRWHTISAAVVALALATPGSVVDTALDKCMRRVPKDHYALDTGGDVRIWSDLGLERFQAQPK